MSTSNLHGSLKVDPSKRIPSPSKEDLTKRDHKIDKPKPAEDGAHTDKTAPKPHPTPHDHKEVKPIEKKEPKWLVNELNKALKERYHTNVDEFENYAEENNLKKGSLGTILKMTQYKLISHLIQEKVKIRDLSWICLYRLFKKHSTPNKKFNNVRTIAVDDFQVFLKDLEIMMAPFEDLHAQLARDISRMKEFESDSNLVDDQYVFAHYIRDTQK